MPNTIVIAVCRWLYNAVVSVHTVTHQHKTHAHTQTTSAINSPEQLEMRRNTYLAIGEATLGKRWGRWPVILFQQILLAGISCAYLLVAGLNIESIYASACAKGGCPVISRVVWTAIVAVIEMMLSFFPTGKVYGKVPPSQFRRTMLVVYF